MATWKPTDDDFLAAIIEQNPWHSLGKVPEELARPTHRPLADVLWQLLLRPQLRRHQVILGPRRVGKTTAMYQTVQMLLKNGVEPNRLWWLRLDHPLLMEISLGQLVKTVLKVTRSTPDNPVYLFLDEVTYSSKWDLWFKTMYDEQWPVRLVGTSSATAAMRERGAESGVGRWNELYLGPYLFTEYLDLREIELPQGRHGASLSESFAGYDNQPFREAAEAVESARRQFMITGGFPELALQASSGDEASDLFRSQQVLRSDAIEKAIYKDIPQAFQIQDPTKLERMLYTLAGQITGLLSPQTIGTDIALSDVSVDKYLKYFERAFLVFTLPNYSHQEETVQRRGRRIYFVDGAVRNAALLRGLGPLKSPEEFGLLTENLAAAHLHALSQLAGVRLYHWRHKQDEVDLVYDHPSDPLAFEITASHRHGTRGIAAFQSQFPRFKGRCYLVSPALSYKPPIDDSPGYLPLDAFLVAVGREAAKSLDLRLGIQRERDGTQLRLRFLD